MLNDRLCDKLEDNERNVKRQRRLQPATDPFTEQIGVFMSSSSSKYVLFSYEKIRSRRDFKVHPVALVDLIF
jgi:hypothetical protein